MIIGIAGTIGAGKGTVVEYLTSKGFAHYSSSGVLKEILKERGQPLTRDYLSPLATEIRAKDPAGLPKINYQKYLEGGGGNAIFEALHTKGEADFIRSVGGVILGIDADLRVRYERTAVRGEERDKGSFDDFCKQARIEDEGSGEDAKRDNNIRAIIDGADAVLLNNGSLEDLHQHLDDLIAKLESQSH